jgi:hypothetical protein
MNQYFKIVLFLFLCSTRVYGQDIGITLKDNFNNSFKVDYELYVLTDTNAKIKFEDAIVSNQFKLHFHSRFEFCLKAWITLNVRVHESGGERRECGPSEENASKKAYNTSIHKSFFFSFCQRAIASNEDYR